MILVETSHTEGMKRFLLSVFVCLFDWFLLVGLGHIKIWQYEIQFLIFLIIFVKDRTSIVITKLFFRSLKNNMSILFKETCDVSLLHCICFVDYMGRGNFCTGQLLGYLSGYHL